MKTHHGTGQTKKADFVAVNEALNITMERFGHIERTACGLWVFHEDIAAPGLATCGTCRRIHATKPEKAG